MPDELQMFVKWLLCGGRDLKGRKDEHMETSAQIVGNVVMYNTKAFRTSCINSLALG